MDRVRFGRALGLGTRHAARALLDAADAATTPDPRANASAHAARPAATPAQSAARVTAHAAHTVQQTSAGVKRGSKRFGQAVWAPVVKVSGVLWLEVTGCFFALFAVFAAVELWRRRADLHSTGAPRQHLVFAAAMFLVFGYFTLSSFIKAHRRSRA